MFWQKIKDFIKVLLPKSLLQKIRPLGHGLAAFNANIIFGHPSNQLIVVGITGTAGKSTTTAMLAHILNNSGRKTGYITTAGFFDGKHEQIGKYSQSMLRGWSIHRELRQMLKNGCRYVIIECTSEGLVQNRHIGINFDIALFTNLSQAHLDAHKGFENYKRAKGLLFKALMQHPITPSKLAIYPALQKTIVSNIDDEYGTYYLNFKATKHLTIGIQNKTANLVPTQVSSSASGITFQLQNISFKLSLPGAFNVYNALLALAGANALGVGLTEIATSLETFKTVAGRMEKISNNLGFQIIVDYAPEPVGMEQILSALNSLPHHKLIHVFGSTGGSRDVAKRFEFGKISSKFADTIIITNDDVYDSDPEVIATNVLDGINEVSSKEKKVKEVLTILDRRQAIAKALSSASKNDMVVITGKGSEQFLVLPENKRIAWDDRAVVREELRNLQK